MKLKAMIAAIAAAAAVAIGVPAGLAMASTTWHTLGYEQVGGQDVFMNLTASRYHVNEIKFTISDSRAHHADIDYYLTCYSSSYNSASKSGSYTVQLPYSRTFTFMPGGYHYQCELDLTVNDHAYDSTDWITTTAKYAGT